MGNCVVSANNQLRMSVLQVTTTLITMASEKYIRWLKFWQKSPIGNQQIWKQIGQIIKHTKAGDTTWSVLPFIRFFLATILQLKVTKRELGALDGEKIS